MKKVLLVISLSVLVISLLCGSIFLLSLRETDVAIYGGCIHLSMGEVYDLFVDQKIEVTVSDGEIIAVRSCEKDGGKYCSLETLKVGHSFLYVKKYRGGNSGSVEYYDVLVSNDMNNVENIMLKRVDTNEEVVFDGNNLPLSFGCEYAIYINGYKLESIPMIPSSSIYLSDYSNGMQGQANVYLNKDNNIVISGSGSGHFILESDMLGSVEINYSVIDGDVPTELLVDSYNKSFGADIDKSNLNLEVSRQMTCLFTDDPGLLSAVSKDYLDRVLPGLKSIQIDLVSDENMLGLVKLPEQIDSVYISSQKDNYTRIVASFVGAGKESDELSVLMDGYINIFSYYDDETAYPVFSEFSDLKVDFSYYRSTRDIYSSYLYLSAVNPTRIVPTFSGIKNLTFNVNANTSIYGSSGFSDSSPNGGKAIECDKLIINQLNGHLTVSGGDGMNGADGADGSNGTNTSPDGRHGVDGGAGMNGGTAIDAASLVVVPTESQYYFMAAGGNGGDGGNGGNGGDGAACDSGKWYDIKYRVAGNGGDAGSGGSGGNGGYALEVMELRAEPSLMLIERGYGGSRGADGTPGSKGACSHWGHLTKGNDGNGASGYATKGKDAFVVLAGTKIVRDSLIFTEKNGALTVELALHAEIEENGEMEKWSITGTKYVLDAVAQETLIAKLESERDLGHLTLPPVFSFPFEESKIEKYLTYVLNGKHRGESYFRYISLLYGVDIVEYEFYPWDGKVEE